MTHFAVSIVVLFKHNEIMAGDSGYKLEAILEKIKLIDGVIEVDIEDGPEEIIKNE